MPRVKEEGVERCRRSRNMVPISDVQYTEE